MNLNRTAICSMVALALISAPAFASIQINFSDDEGDSTPGFRISNQDINPGSELVELGSNTVGRADGVDFQRVTGANGDTNGSDILGFIVVIPEVLITNFNVPDQIVFGQTISSFPVVFAGTGTNMSAAGGFQIYHASDTGLTSPLLSADMKLTDDFVSVGSSGLFEASIAINLMNVQLSLAGEGFASLVAFRNQAAVAQANPGDYVGPDFNFNISDAGNNIAQSIRQGQSVTGSASGSIFAVPEPGTMLLLVGGAMGMIRRRRSA